MMCTNPVAITNQKGEVVSIHCRKCWQCRRDRVDDWVGRNIAEQKTSVGASVLTLTYGTDNFNESDHVHARILMYSDFQKFLKRLRFDGYPVRYFVTGEYGSTKGRAHWHALVYWLKAVPELKIRAKAWMLEQWPHGWCYVDTMSAESVRYATKYIMKDEADPLKRSLFRMSRKPPLGTQWFINRAREFAKAGLAPNDLSYSFRDVKRAGQPVKFIARGRIAEIYIDEYIEAWRLLNGNRHMPSSEAVEARLDALARQAGDPQWRPQPMFKPGSWEERRFLERLRWAKVRELTPEEVAAEIEKYQRGLSNGEA